MLSMAVKLIISRVKLDSPRLHPGAALRKRGAEGRRVDRERREQRARNLGAGMTVVANCAVLWGLFWFQVVIGIPYGQPLSIPSAAETGLRLSSISI